MFHVLGKNTLFYIIILLLIAGSIFLWVMQSKNRSKRISLSIPRQELSPTPSPTPIALHKGKGTYHVSQSAHIGPSVSQVVFDPLDVQKGQTLIITVTTSPTDSLMGTLITDNSEHPLTFTKTSTNNKQNQWQTQIKLSDTVWYQYILSLTARSNNQNTTVKIAPRSR
jgi:hypothetical protein